MKNIAINPVPLRSDASGVLSWAHIGDLHLTTRSHQNYADFMSIVDRLNRNFVAGLNFVYLPGDHAEHGSRDEYELVGSAIDRLQLPCFCVVGDHDVLTGSFTPYEEALRPAGAYSMETGGCRFIALNTFSVPVPDSFTVDDAQVAWLRRQLVDAASRRLRIAIFMHCYPSDLKQGYEPIRDLIREFKPVLVEMGHTHYNEIAHDAWTVYAATRSTGQIEEGPVGFSITNIDQGCVSWKFIELSDEDPVVMITYPADWRLRPRRHNQDAGSSLVRVRIWCQEPIKHVYARVNDAVVLTLSPVPDSNLWMCHLPPGEIRNIRVTVESAGRKSGSDCIVVTEPASVEKPIAERDQDNAVGAWPDRGILGTQLGPNKNGRKW